MARLPEDGKRCQELYLMFGKTDSFLNSEKIFYHQGTVRKLLTEGVCYPVHLELGLTNYCNHNCTFCYASRSKFDALGRPRMAIDMARLQVVLEEMRDLGLKAVTLVGSGEPTLHPQTAIIIRMIRSLGLDVGLFTNGSAMTDKLATALAECCTFVRFSLTGASPQVHKLVHGSTDYENVIAGIKRLVAARTRPHNPTIGIQFVLASYSAQDLRQGAINAKAMGVDYFSVKPCFPSPENSHQLENTLSPLEAARYAEGLELLSTPDFTVYVKKNQMERVFTQNEPRPYSSCLGGYIATVMDSDFSMYYCGNMETAAFMYGSVAETSFKNVWEGEGRRAVLQKIVPEQCPPGCRMSNINNVLNTVKSHCIPCPATPPSVKTHVNFL